MKKKKKKIMKFMLRKCFKNILNIFIRKKRVFFSLSVFIYLAGLIFFCEFLIYYIVEYRCYWPENDDKSNDQVEPVKAMILADTHMLGPRRGHWFDKLRREWQMHRSFQTAVYLFDPEIIFILGDIFDEGEWVTYKEFQDYVRRFHKLFYIPKNIKLIAVVGNHDIGFHYRLHPFYTERFEETFNNTGVSLHTFKNVHFITINSMAMENDNCYFCEKAIHELEKVSRILNCAKEPLNCERNKNLNMEYSQPIILQHFPTYRPSDESCIEHDSPIIEKYREKWEVLSKYATRLLGKLLNPRLVFSGHSHHFCKLKNQLGIEEYTVASFNWRNKNDPSFLLAKFTPTKHLISVCKLPEEITLKFTYVMGILFLFILKIYF